MLLAAAIVCVLVATVTASPVGAGTIPVDIQDLEKLGINPDDLLLHLRRLAEGNYVCGFREISDMRRHFLRNRTVTCNDGSPAGYYLRKSKGNTRWLVFLEGGWFCFDALSCQGRRLNTPHLMTSEHWPDRRKGSGILSWDPEENPFLYNANLVFVPYCSSDSWSGTYKARHRGDFSFMGSLIVEEVLRDLASDQGMETATKMYLAGSSAGGTGVLVNLDHAAALMSTVAPQVEVRGISDSGWFLDNKQYKSVPCTDAHSCAPTDSVKRGIQLWHGRVPKSCAAIYPATEQWKCYFGYRLYPTIKTPVFVIQHLFDEAQITADNVGPPIKKEQWQYIHDVGQDMKQTMMNVSAVFAPACLSHILLTKSAWHRVAIHGVTLPEALRCWEDGTHEQNRYQKLRGSKGDHYYELAHRLITGQSPRKRNGERPLGDDPRSKEKKRHKKKKKRRRDRERRKTREERQRDRERRLRKQELNQSSNFDLTDFEVESRRYRRLKRSRSKSRSRTLKDEESSSDRGYSLGVLDPSFKYERVRSRRWRRSAIFFDLHDVHHVRYHENRCSHHRLDHCAWPQCNLSCPKIHNPFTGDEMDFIDLLMQFGLDLSSIADALGMDLPTLQNMDHDTLLRLLIRNAR